MGTIRTLIVFAFVFCIFSCNKKEEENIGDPIPKDLLDYTGILGKWEIYERSTNGISDMLPVCCEFIEFKEDKISQQDLLGEAIVTTPNYSKSGTFLLRSDAKTMDLVLDGDTFTREYRIEEDILNLNYTQDSITYSENYKPIRFPI